MRKPKVVLDTNVLISALLFPKSELAKIYSLWLEGKFELITSEPLFQELADSLTKLGPKYGITPGDSIEITKKMRKWATWIELEHIPKVVRDPKDDKVVATAVSAKADALITGDKDILALGKIYRGIKIQKPSEFFT